MVDCSFNLDVTPAVQCDDLIRVEIIKRSLKRHNHSDIFLRLLDLCFCSFHDVNYCWNYNKVYFCHKILNYTKFMTFIILRLLFIKKFFFFFNGKFHCIIFFHESDFVFVIKSNCSWKLQLLSWNSDVCTKMIFFIKLKKFLTFL